MQFHRMKAVFAVGALALGGVVVPANAAKKQKTEEKHPSALDVYIREAQRHAATVTTSPGSLWSPSSRFNDLGADLRAAHLDDIVTIVVNEQTSAVSGGTTKTSRASSANASVNAFYGALKKTSPWTNLLNSNSNTSLDGEGTTSRTTTLNSTLAARVVGVMANGNLIVEGVKTLGINSENEMVSVRGVVRPLDLNADNTVSADRLADVEVKVNGRGVVNDVVRRPNFLYRLLLGLLPF
ncbi:MAG TPA: flagellar basal body L-ring protein FlgH [Bryobacteraceae bacterium]|nr:flagellar basal body L-ring protein FlgH [Bryobacteraceae bacterium]